MLFKPEIIAVNIQKSLRESPDFWTNTQYRLTNGNGLSIWIANEAWGIDVDGHKPSQASRNLIYKSYGEWLGNKALKRAKG